MRIIILGAGQVGRTAAYHLAREEDNEITVVDTNDELLRDLQERRHRAVQAVLDRMPNRVQHELLLALVAFSQAATATAPQAGSDSTARTA